MNLRQQVYIDNMDVVKVNLNEKSYNINIGAVVLNDASHIFGNSGILEPMSWSEFNSILH